MRTTPTTRGSGQQIRGQAEGEEKVDSRPKEPGSMWAALIFIVSNGHFGLCRQPRRPRLCPNSARQQQRSERKEREENRFSREIHCIRYRQIDSLYSERLRGCISSAHICRRRYLIHPGELQSMIHLQYTVRAPMLTISSWAQENMQAIESLAPRIKSPAASFCAPIPECDTKEGLSRGLKQ